MVRSTVRIERDFKNWMIVVAVRSGDESITHDHDGIDQTRDAE
jgi:anti-sigma factor ChrR (cupin superfamily)